MLLVLMISFLLRGREKSSSPRRLRAYSCKRTLSSGDRIWKLIWRFETGKQTAKAPQYSAPWCVSRQLTSLNYLLCVLLLCDRRRQKNKSQPRPVHRIPFNLFEMLSWVWLNDINTSCWYLCTKRSSDRGGWRSVRWVLLEELVFCPGWDVFKERGEVEPRLIKVQLRRTCRTASQSSPPPPPVDTCGTSRGSWWKRCWRIWMRQERKTV